MNILIVEDEILISELLLVMLEELGHTVIGQAVNYDSAIEILESEHSIDLIFCDINLNESKTGINLAFEINSKYKIPYIFLTSYSDTKTVQEAYGNLPSGYLIKPFNKVTINASLILEESKLKLKSPSVFIFKGEVKTKALLNAIDYVSTENNYILIHIAKEKFMQRTSLDAFMEQTKNSTIFRTHRSFAVNLAKVISFSTSELRVDKNLSIPLSRKYKNEVLENVKKINL